MQLTGLVSLFPPFEFVSGGSMAILGDGERLIITGTDEKIYILPIANDYVYRVTLIATYSEDYGVGELPKVELLDLDDNILRQVQCVQPFGQNEKLIFENIRGPFQIKFISIGDINATAIFNNVIIEWVTPVISSIVKSKQTNRLIMGFSS